MRRFKSYLEFDGGDCALGMLVVRSMCMNFRQGRSVVARSAGGSGHSMVQGSRFFFCIGKLCTFDEPYLGPYNKYVHNLNEDVTTTLLCLLFPTERRKFVYFSPVEHLWFKQIP